jgi:hypothetical protein
MNWYLMANRVVRWQQIMIDEIWKGGGYLAIWSWNLLGRLGRTDAVVYAVSGHHYCSSLASFYSPSCALSPRTDTVPGLMVRPVISNHGSFGSLFFRIAIIIKPISRIIPRNQWDRRRWGNCSLVIRIQYCVKDQTPLYSRQLQWRNY